MKIPVIPYQLVKKPQNLFGKWLRLPPYIQWITLIILLCGTATVALLYWYPQHQQYKQLLQQSAQKQNDLHHQQQLLATLQHKIAQTQLTPEIAKTLPPINHYIQHQTNANKLSLLQSKWHYFSRPHLTLEIQGKYSNLALFLTALRQKFPQLKLNKLAIHQSIAQASHQIQSNIIFILE